MQGGDLERLQSQLAQLLCPLLSCNECENTGPKFFLLLNISGHTLLHTHNKHRLVRPLQEYHDNQVTMLVLDGNAFYFNRNYSLPVKSLDIQYILLNLCST